MMKQKLTRDKMTERQYVNRPSQAGKRPPSKRLKQRRAENFEAAQPGYFPNPVSNVPALDDYDADELWKFFQRHKGGNHYKELFPESGKGAKKAAADLASFAAYSSYGKTSRLNGNVRDALHYEREADKIYKSLPHWAKPDYEPNPQPKNRASNPRRLRPGPLHVLSDIPPSERKQGLPHLFPQPGGKYHIAFWNRSVEQWIGTHMATSLKDAREWLRKEGHSKAVLLQ